MRIFRGNNPFVTLFNVASLFLTEKSSYSFQFVTKTICFCGYSY